MHFKSACKPDSCSLDVEFTVTPDFSEEAVGLEVFVLGVSILPPSQNLVHRNARPFQLHRGKLFHSQPPEETGMQ